MGRWLQRRVRTGRLLLAIDAADVRGELRGQFDHWHRRMLGSETQQLEAVACQLAGVGGGHGLNQAHAGPWRYAAGDGRRNDTLIVLLATLCAREWGDRPLREARFHRVQNYDNDDAPRPTRAAPTPLDAARRRAPPNTTTRTGSRRLGARPAIMKPNVPTGYASFQESERFGRLYTGGKVDVSHDGTLVVCQCGEELKVVAVETGKVVATVSSEGDEFTCFVMHPSKLELVSASRSRQIRHTTLAMAPASWRR